MKANLKGLDGMKQLLLAHGEKLGIAVVGICAAMMIYHSILRDKLPADKQADRLNEQITLARKDMNNYTWPKMKAEHPGDIREFKPLEQKGNISVDPGNYVGPFSQIGWDSPVVPPTVLRTDPLLLEPQGLEGSGGSGLLAFADPEVRRKKMLEEQTKAAQLSSKQKKEMEKQQEDDGRGNATSRGRAGQGREDLGAGVYDPEHPKRKAVVGMVRPAGVPLQDYEEVKVAHWAIVVAKVPIKEQVKLYRDAFENARDSNPAADVPQYLGYFVDRAEVRPGDEDKDLTWQRVSVYDGKSTIPIAPVVSADAIYGKPEDPNPASKKAAVNGVVTNWAMQMPEIVDPRYLGDGALAFPLPPLVGRDWGSEVTHSEVPLAIDALPPEEEVTTPDAAQPAAATDAEPTDFFSGGPAAGAGMAGRQPAMGGRGGYGTSEVDRGGYDGRGYGGGMGGRGGYSRGGEEGYRGGGYASAGAGGTLGQNGEPQAPHWLLRFFDFSVEPGKKYKYRIQLAMLDPNQPFGARFVSTDSLDPAAQSRIKKERTARKVRPGVPPPPYRLTEWSKPTAPVSVPLAGSVKVASAKPATDKFNDEPSTSLLVESFGNDEKGNAVQVAEDENFHRGNVANLTKDTKMLVEQNRAYDPVPKFPFRTGITVVDIRGGERLTREAQRTARVLLMGPAGQLFVQDELDDAEAIEMHKAAFAEEAPGGAAGGFMGRPSYEGRGGYPSR